MQLERHGYSHSRDDDRRELRSLLYGPQIVNYDIVFINSESRFLPMVPATSRIND